MVRRLTCLAACLVLLASAASDGASGTAETARRLAIEAKYLLGEDRVAEAIEKLELALAVAPDHPLANALMTDARGRLAQVEDHVTAADRHRRRAAWDEALAAVRAARKRFPAHAEATALETRIRAEAADAVAKDAELIRATGDLAEAEAAYRRALAFDPASAAARQGLAALYVQRGDAAMEASRPGAALAWYAGAAAVDPEGAAPDRAAAARAPVAARVRFRLAEAPGGDPAGSVLTMAVRGWLARVAPPALVELASPPPGSTAEGYAWRLRTTGPQVADQVRSEPRTHTYVVGREVPNPAVERIQSQLDAELFRLRILREQYDRPCPRCDGRGWVLCLLCGGTGRDPYNPLRPCPRCGWRHFPGRYDCPRCGGTGRGGIPLHELREQERVVDRLQALLARTPPTVVREEPAQWPYTVEHHERTGRLDASAELVDLATGARQPAGGASPRAREADTTVLGANPGVGLAADPLELPPAAEIERRLVDEAADALADRVLAAALGARRAALEREAAALRQKGNVVEAVERQAEAALIATVLEPERDPFEAVRAALRAR